MTDKDFEYEEKKAQREYDRYLSRRGITKEEHEKEIAEFLDSLD